MKEMEHGKGQGMRKSSASGNDDRLKYARPEMLCIMKNVGKGEEPPPPPEEEY